MSRGFILSRINVVTHGHPTSFTFILMLSYV